MTMNRRTFLRNALLSTASIAAAPSLFAQSFQGSEKRVREFLKGLLYTRNEVDQWLAGEAFPFAKYSSEFGWLLPNARFRDGIDDSVSLYTFAQPDG